MSDTTSAAVFDPATGTFITAPQTNAVARAADVTANADTAQPTTAQLDAQSRAENAQNNYPSTGSLLSNAWNGLNSWLAPAPAAAEANADAETTMGPTPVQTIGQASIPQQSPLAQPPTASVPANLPGYGPGPVGPTDSDAPTAAEGAAPQPAADAPQAPPSPAPTLPPAVSVGAPPVPPGAPPAQDRYHALASSMVSGESGGDPTAKNPNSSAAGSLQVEDGLWSDYLKSPDNPGWKPADKLNPTAQLDASAWQMKHADTLISSQLGRPATDDELLASHLLGPGGVSALAQDPTAPSYVAYASAAGPQTADQAFRNNGNLLQRGDTGAATISKVAAYYRAQAGQPGRSPSPTPGQPPAQLPGQGPGAPAATGPSALTPADNQPGMQMLADVGIPNLDPSLYRSSASEKLMGLAAGLLGAPSLGIGLSRGLTNMGNLQQQDRTNNLKAQSDIVAQARAMAQIQNQNNLFNLKAQPKPTGKLTAAANGRPGQQEFIDPTSGQTFWKDLPGQTNADVRGQQGDTRLQQGAQRVANQTATVQGNLSGATAANRALYGGAVKEGQADADTIQAQGQAANQKLQAINNFETLSQSPDTNAGPELQQQAKRYFATEMGLGGNVTGTQLAEALSKQVASGGFSAAKGITIRNQKEFDFFKDQMANIDTDPHAAALLLAPAKMAAQHQVDVYNAWNAMPIDQQQGYVKTPGAFDKWRYGQDQAYFQKLGVQGGSSSPTIAQSPGGTWHTVSVNGKPIQIGNVTVTPSN